MDNLKRTAMFTALAVVMLAFILSIYGAFLGAEKAGVFFNSMALAVFWLLFLFLIAISPLIFKSILRSPALFLTHTGVAFILAGALWGSETAHNLRRNVFKIDKIYKANMLIYQGQDENRAVLEDNTVKDMPFSVRLNKFEIKYYQPEFLHIHSRKGDSWKIPVEIGKEFSLGKNSGTVQILKKFENFKITFKNNETTAIDSPTPGINPALQVQLKDPQGNVKTKYVFQNLSPHMKGNEDLVLSYNRVIADYISKVDIVKDNKIIASKDIEVNHPLHAEGYHFYQHSYDSEAGLYTILSITSDSGLYIVYTGYIMLCGAVFWHFWLRHIPKLKKNKDK